MEREVRGAEVDTNGKDIHCSDWDSSRSKSGTGPLGIMHPYGENRAGSEPPSSLSVRPSMEEVGPHLLCLE
jgi:hypothetical protein